MKLVMEGQPLLVHIGVWTCVAVFLTSTVGLLSGICLTLIRTEALATKPDEIGLTYWERAARKNNRASSIFVQDRLRYLLYLLLGSGAGVLSSFIGLLVIIGAFGERG